MALNEYNGYSAFFSANDIRHITFGLACSSNPAFLHKKKDYKQKKGFKNVR